MATTMRRDLPSAYVAAGPKVLTWVIVGGLVYRFISPGAFALLAMIRGTIGVLNYITLGFSPAIIHLLPQAERDQAVHDAASAPSDGQRAAEILYANVVAASLITLA